MSTLDVESIDLVELAAVLAVRVPGGAREGELDGRTAFRDATISVLRCSALEAEELVDTLVARGFLVYAERAPDAVGTWQVHLDAA